MEHLLKIVAAQGPLARGYGEHVVCLEEAFKEGMMPTPYCRQPLLPSSDEADQARQADIAGYRRQTGPPPVPRVSAKNKKEKKATKGEKKPKKAAGVWERKAWQEKRLKRANGQQRQLKLSEEAVALQAAFDAMAEEWRRFAESEYELRQPVADKGAGFDPGSLFTYHVHTYVLTCIIVTAGSTPAAGGSGPCGQTAGHLRLRSDPGPFFNYIQDLRKNLEAGSTNTTSTNTSTSTSTSTTSTTNTTRSQACAEVTALQHLVLGNHPAVAKQLKALGTELEVQHGGKSVVTSTAPLVGISHPFEEDLRCS